MSSDSHNQISNANSGAADESLQEVHDTLRIQSDEPSEGFTYLPLFILGLVSTMIFIVSIYFVHHRADFDSLVHDERIDPAQLKAATVVVADPLVAGKKLYSTCMACHQENGKGVAGAFPPLAGSEWVLGSEERLIRILVHGLNGPITVSGNQYNGNMPAFGVGSGYNWSDQKIAQVLTYIRHEWGNNASPISEEKVAEVRLKGSPGRSAQWTAAELESFP